MNPSYQDVAGQRPAELPGLDSIASLLDECHDHAGRAQDALDRALGSGPPGESKVSPVPNGKLDQLRESLMALRGRLDGIATRAARIA